MSAATSKPVTLGVGYMTHDEESLAGSDFARSIAAMSRGTLRQNKKEYAPFKEGLWEKPHINPSFGNAHISSDYDYHEKETKAHWEKANGQKSVFQSGTHSKGRSFPTIGSLLGTTQPRLIHDNVRVFGRTREIRPFSRTKTCGYHEHNTSLLSKHIFRDKVLYSIEPNPTTYHPYPDTWQKKAVCGVVMESSAFRSESPSRTFRIGTAQNSSSDIEEFISHHQGTFRDDLGMNSVEHSEGPSSPNYLVEDSTNLVSMSLFLSRQARGEEKSKIHQKKVNFRKEAILGNKIMNNTEKEKTKKTSGTGTIDSVGMKDSDEVRHTLHHLEESVFDDSDGESVCTYMSQQIRKQGQNRLSYRTLKSNFRNRPNKSNSTSVDNRNNYNEENSEIMTNNSDDEKIEKMLDGNKYLIENIKRHRDHLLNLGSRPHTHGISIGKEFRTSSWLCKQDNVKERDDQKDKDAHLMNYSAAAKPLCTNNAHASGLIQLSIKNHDSSSNSMTSLQSDGQSKRTERTYGQEYSTVSNQSSSIGKKNAITVDFNPPKPRDIIEKNENNGEVRGKGRGRERGRDEGDFNSTYPNSSNRSEMNSEKTLHTDNNNSNKMKSSQNQIENDTGNILPISDASSPSKSTVNRPKSAPKLFDWQPKMYQSKSILQRKYEKRELLCLNDKNTVDKFLSSMIHSRVADIMPVNCRISKNKIIENIENIKHNESTKKGKNNLRKKSAEINREKLSVFDNEGNEIAVNVINTVQRRNSENRLLSFSPINKGDLLGSHVFKKSSNKESRTIFDVIDMTNTSNNVLEKTSHLVSN